MKVTVGVSVGVSVGVIVGVGVDVGVESTLREGRSWGLTWVPRLLWGSNLGEAEKLSMEWMSLPSLQGALVLG